MTDNTDRAQPRENDPLDGQFDHLQSSAQSVGWLARRPVIVMAGLIGALWLMAAWLLVEMAGTAAVLGDAHRLGPGMELVARWLPFDPTSFAGVLAGLCLTVGDPGLLMNGAGLPLFGVLVLMWAAMAIAMMTPTAAPLIRTYVEIADTAAARGTPTIHPLVLVAGYLTVWLLAAIWFAVLHLALMSAFGLEAAAPFRGAVAGLILLLAGAYQFTGFKEACLSKCRNPFTTLFSRWRQSMSGVFRLGVEQGLWCLGCCWALMLVMFAAGAMNVIWMAALALFTFVEKTGSGRVTSRVGGTIVALWGLALIGAGLFGY